MSEPTLQDVLHAEAIIESRQCPNCALMVGHEPTGCMVEMVISVLHDRYISEDADFNERFLRRLDDMWADMNVDALWQAIGPIVDDVENGAYNTNVAGLQDILP
jgi:hypothetical protein